jgi:hypothetical protein
MLCWLPVFCTLLTHYLQQSLPGMRRKCEIINRI